MFQNLISAREQCNNFVLLARSVRKVSFLHLVQIQATAWRDLLYLVFFLTGIQTFVLCFAVVTD